MSDTLAETLRYLEGREFFAKCAIASSIRQLKRIIRDDPHIHDIWNLSNMPVVVAGRIQHLLLIPYNKNYAHPCDTTIAAYMWLLKYRKWIPFNHFQADEVNVNGLFWARQMEREVEVYDD